MTNKQCTCFTCPLHAKGYNLVATVTTQKPPSGQETPRAASELQSSHRAEAHKEIIPPTTWEEKFDEKFCREDKSLEKRGRMDVWFLREEVTGRDVKSFIRGIIAAEKERAIEDEVAANEQGRAQAIAEVLEVIEGLKTPMRDKHKNDGWTETEKFELSYNTALTVLSDKIKKMV